MCEQEIESLKALLFGKTISRNKNFERFEEPKQKRILRIARLLRKVHTQLQDPEIIHWQEKLDDGRICIRIHQPTLDSLRSVMLTQQQHDLLSHPAWKELSST